MGRLTDSIHPPDVVCEVIPCKALGSVGSARQNTLLYMIINVLNTCTAGVFLSDTHGQCRHSTLYNSSTPDYRVVYSLCKEIVRLIMHMFAPVGCPSPRIRAAYSTHGGALEGGLFRACESSHQGALLLLLQLPPLLHRFRGATSTK